MTISVLRRKLCGALVLASVLLLTPLGDNAAADMGAVDSCYQGVSHVSATFGNHGSAKSLVKLAKLAAKAQRLCGKAQAYLLDETSATSEKKAYRKMRSVNRKLASIEKRLGRVKLVLPDEAWEAMYGDLWRGQTHCGQAETLLDARKRPGGSGGGGRLSPASLDVDTCGCPTTFGDPECEDRTDWSLDKTTGSGPFVNPAGEAFLFDVTVTEGPTSTILSGSGQIIITNSGDQTPSLSSVAVLLEGVAPGGTGDAPGPSGKNWNVLGVTAENEAAACGATSVSCSSDEPLEQIEGSNLVLYDCDDSNDIIALSDSIDVPPSADNDGDGLRDEDPEYTGANDTANSCDFIDADGDGLYDEDPPDGLDNDADGAVDEDGPDEDGDGADDEDGACEDAVVICFDYEFDITGLGLEGPGDMVVPSEDDLRIDLLVTFKAGGKRGGTCSADVDCDGVTEDGKGGDPDEGEGHVRTVQQRHRFDPPACTEICKTVTLTDAGAFALDDTCVDVVNGYNDANDVIDATGADGTVSAYSVEGTVECICVSDSLDDLEDALAPYNDIDDGGGSANMVVAHPGGDSYFNATLTNAGDFSGLYDSWCVDVDNTISPGANYCVELVSTYSDFAQQLVDFPEHLDAVNWILNQDYTAQAATCMMRDYTYGDIQRAIWDLIDPTSSSGLGTWSQCAADEIRTAALASGDGFEPGCDEFVGVIQNPCGNTQSGSQSGVVQITIFQITMSQIVQECEDCAGCSTTVTNTAELTCNDDSLIEGSPASASFDVTCEGGEPEIVVGDFCSQTQGGWGTDNCNGNNTACLRDLFDFTSGLIVGDPDGPDMDALYAILLTSSSAVAEYLPAGGDPAALTADQTDPETTSSGVFGGQLTAATLNVAFDDAGIGKCTLTGDCEFGYEPGTLGTLVYGECVVDALQGLSVNEVIALANIAISGGGLPVSVGYSDLSEALARLNEEFVDCDTVATGCLTLP